MISIILSVLIGLAAAGLVHLSLRLVKVHKKTRMAISVVAAGLGMMSYQIYDEYTWYIRASTRLGPDMQVLETYNENSFLRPWAQNWPYVSRFSAVNHKETKTNENLPDMFIVTTYLAERNQTTLKIRHIIDCKESRRSYFDAKTTFDDQGQPVGAAWYPLPADEPLLLATCNRP